MPNPFDDRKDRAGTKITMTYVLLIGFNIGAWVWAWTAFSDRPALLGTAFLAYMLGLRHAFDADHIAAIDNVVRKLVQDKKSPVSVGFFFSLGHSSIVVLASIAIAATASMMPLGAFRDVGGIVGTSVSALFLVAIGVANFFVLRGIWAAFRRARRGETIVEEDLDALLSNSGFLARIFRPMFKIVTRSWHMYPIGFLFGLGFDTATEIGLLGISATQAAQGMSFWTILVFPALFTAGMSLLDTTDSVLMTRAYGWAFINPMRKLWYNLTITAASVAVAIFIGGMEALGLLVDKFGLEGGVWGTIADLNDNLANFGYAVVGIFVVSWLISTLVYKMRGYDDVTLNLAAGQSTTN
ncbi:MULTISPECIES: HoxN/HupN/NixA family nickel/cobalt transporter [Rhizobium]|uniref:Nickel/cobalt efflux system n=1 Tax=Rhizobium rhododendri TaxID=2506430 RepID=A0ABY8IKR0_9HYPH|nr:MULTISPECIES: HoxN/HupN/NixA family nickel/cobalt transporter [Rhizobium]MBZ5758028.1 HoxN/HupN/NixA family nickel/cobalt transporter [Rhizobium sp. VS19-DR96]MBZ5765142.1 HoxN/HupN/NixA family nickel/cobalt transporter [Rhizobium sp. VS19-DR129.2]MBZ5772685.1 HoxN/HupN/NixA family nickel/cobalt transporter [Rhizobium sp. VS19-DRK62.2]MBZ5782628.1 HoxN/HupN/NixA family nickel/cobalt transporter [Rhizobium sp. VS19-DR121]MBZ5800076.1 HoxN/HupN/NixA family nickel/cobalt transporter [Rhizobium